MIEDINLALTAKGQALMAKIQKGNGTLPLNLTRVVTGAGTDPDPLNLDAVVDERQTFAITSRQTTGSRTSIEAMLSNMGNALEDIPPLEQGYPLSQIGFYAMDPDEGEILYRISQFTMPNYVPAASERGWVFSPVFNFLTGNAKNVVIHIESSDFAVRSDIWKSVELSAADTPDTGVRTHYRITDAVANY